MLTINLISHGLKKEIKLRHIYTLLKNVNSIIFIIILFSSIALTISKGLIQENFNRIVDETTLITKNSQGYNQKVKEINTKLNGISKIQDEYIPWSYFLETIALNTPNDLKFNSINISQSDKTIKITGYSATRASLLDFKAFMENDKSFKNVDFPLKNIMQKNDINFAINANLDIDVLKDNLKK